MKKLVLFLLLSFILTSILFAQRKGFSLPNAEETGKCHFTIFVKKEIAKQSRQKEKRFPKRILKVSPAVFQTIQDTLLIHAVAEDTDKALIRNKHTKIRDEYTVWAKRKIDGNYISANPDDAIKLCLLQQPANYKTIYYIENDNPPTDTLILSKNILIQDAKLEYIPFDKKIVLSSRNNKSRYKNNETLYFLQEKGYWTAWQKITCNIPKEGISMISIQEKLLALGYNMPPNENLFLQIRPVLKKFQEDNNLHVGSVDCETLRALGIEY